MQRYFVNKEQISEQTITLLADDAKHIQKVMRMNPGDRLICADNEGNVYLCEIQSLESDCITAVIKKQLEENAELPIHVTIVQGLPKGDKLEFIVQKGTECGARAFIPLKAERSISKWAVNKVDKKLSRLKKIAKEAAEQSHRTYIPEIGRPVSIDQLIKMSDHYHKKIVAYEETAKAGEQHALPKILNEIKANERLIAVIGPEGGFSPEEVQKLEQAGFTSCGLGNRILRTETAPLYVLSAASYHFELLKRGE
ncbi:16S rRNA (uracil1498-N3)-methyltransferase [Scopulibacillus daqui]|uniref:Ribosomal RNA small subunit methyltransferase E n=1 Tax=Scopulibacillus daqui TaxID=1469162 RepID=A0ABS2Q0I6_9BACL|nr:16S rRNA (uracil(1498)-N(3))-methyltransferase [Scopulibacillus daqui]MBM7645807.1 16S rRNA (uracil1498-N3)-methyltransferase [Scopulibacillus daqui]